MRRVDVASALITNDKGQLLLVRNVKGHSSYWGLPGGAVEKGETLEQAAVREVKEETGYDIAITGLSSLREMFFRDAGNHAFIVTFFAKIVGGEMDARNDPDRDIAEVRWADLPTAKRLMPSFIHKLQIRSTTDKTPAFYAFEGTI
ncbi:NUDIX hydrolase [Paenibacillus hodogayensis]|uniref:NUDIX hydrolase n=1 Tax=Paenibacillus hodogayensis TaxID=279208 RepID=A0ABV5VZV7_9BACL